MFRLKAIADMTADVFSVKVFGPPLFDMMYRFM
jgi:hypothetical protein